MIPFAQSLWIRKTVALSLDGLRQTARRLYTVSIQLSRDPTAILTVRKIAIISVRILCVEDGRGSDRCVSGPFN